MIRYLLKRLFWMVPLLVGISLISFLIMHLAPGDITDAGDRGRIVATAEETLGPIEVLVNNAGITRDGLVARMGDDQWGGVMRTNLDGAFHAIRRAVPGMMRARFGRIVNISSVSGVVGTAGQANYAASKAGLVGLSRSITRELGSRNITANVVAPGFVQTDMTDALPEAQRKAYLDSIPAKRFATAEELKARVTRALHEYALATSAAPVLI